jgi:hypothetical protein
MQKLFFLFLGFLVLSSTGLSAQQQSGQSKHSPIITVQGHPHDGLTKRYGGKPYIKPAPKPKLGDINPTQVLCWSGHLNPAIGPEYVDSAYLIVKWTNVQSTEADSILIWGYVWNTISIYVSPDSSYRDTSAVTVHSIDMLRTVANSDCRLLVLLQQTGVNGYTVGGIGYNVEAGNQRVPIRFDLAGAKADTANIHFKYNGSPNCTLGQTAVPFQPDSQAIWAIRAATPGTLTYATGIIEHPFNVNYGYPAYDYDHWLLNDTTSNPDYRWQSGWNPSAWIFYTGENRQIPTDPSYYGATTRVLTENSVDGYIFTPTSTWPPAVDFSGTPFFVKCPCNPCPPIVPSKPKHKPVKL